MLYQRTALGQGHAFGRCIGGNGGQGFFRPRGIHGKQRFHLAYSPVPVVFQVTIHGPHGLQGLILHTASPFQIVGCLGSNLQYVTGDFIFRAHHTAQGIGLTGRSLRVAGNGSGCQYRVRFFRHGIRHNHIRAPDFSRTGDFDVPGGSSRHGLQRAVGDQVAVDGHGGILVHRANGSAVDKVPLIAFGQFGGKILRHTAAHIVDRVSAAKEGSPFRHVDACHVGFPGIGQGTALHVQFHIVRAGNIAAVCHVPVKIQVRHQVGDVRVIGIAVISGFTVVLDEQARLGGSNGLNGNLRIFLPFIPILLRFLFRPFNKL